DSVIFADIFLADFYKLFRWFNRIYNRSVAAQRFTEKAGTGSDICNFASRQFYIPFSQFFKKYTRNIISVFKILLGIIMKFCLHNKFPSTNTDYLILSRYFTHMSTLRFVK